MEMDRELIEYSECLLFVHEVYCVCCFCMKDDLEPVELIKKPKEYVVKFSFPLPPPLNPPILGLKCKLMLME